MFVNDSGVGSLFLELEVFLSINTGEMLVPEKFCEFSWMQNFFHGFMRGSPLQSFVDMFSQSSTNTTFSICMSWHTMQNLVLNCTKTVSLFSAQCWFISGDLNLQFIGAQIVPLNSFWFLTSSTTSLSSSRIGPEQTFFSPGKQDFFVITCVMITWLVSLNNDRVFLQWISQFGQGVGHTGVAVELQTFW